MFIQQYNFKVSHTKAAEGFLDFVRMPDMTGLMTVHVNLLIENAPQDSVMTRIAMGSLIKSANSWLNVKQQSVLIGIFHMPSVKLSCILIQLSCILIQLSLTVGI